MTVTYMPCCSEDADSIFEMCREVVERYEDLTSIDPEKVLTWLQNKIKDNIRQYSRICVDGNTVGYYRLHREGNSTELDDFYILPQWRGKGIGSAVLKDCFAQVDGDIFLYVFTANLGAVRLYQRHGFAVSEYVSKTRCIMTRKG